MLATSVLPFLTAMARHSGMSFIAIDRDARITHIIGDVKHGFDGDTQMMIGQSIDSFFPDEPSHVRLYYGALNNHPSEVTIRTKYGGFSDIQILPLHDDNNNIIGALGFGNDVTEREQEAKTHEALTHDVFTSIQDGIFVIDRDYTVVKTNPAFDQMYSEHLPIIGKKCFVTSCLDHVCDECPAVSTFETGKMHRLVHYKQPTDTKPGMWLEHFTYPLFSPSGEVASVISIIRDYTQSVDDEKKLEQYRHQLEVMVEERTRNWEQSEAKIQMILAEGGIPILFTNAQGIIEFTNAAFQEMTGYPDEEIVGKPASSVYEQYTIIDSEFMQKRADMYTGKTNRVRHDIQFRRQDGNVCWMDLTIIAVRSSEGTLLQIISILLDVTERYQLLRTIEDANELNKIMLEGYPLGCTIFSQNGTIIDCNMKVLQWSGLASKQEYRETFAALLPEHQTDGQSSKKQMKQILKTVLETGYMCFEWELRIRDGQVVPVEITAIRGRRGNEDIVIVYSHDLREHKKMLAEMREADERTRLMLDAMPLCCNLWDNRFRNIACNLETVKLFELKDKQEYLDRYLELSPKYQPDGRLSKKKAIEQVKTAFQEGRCQFEWLFQKLDGTPIPSDVTLVRIQQGNEYIVAGYARDMREIKRHEAIQQRNQNRANILLEIAQMTHVSEQEVIDYIIRSVVTLTDSTMGFVVLLEHAAGLLPFRSLFLDELVACSLPTMTDTGAPHILSTVLTECLASKKAMIYNDMYSLPGARTFPAGHAEIRSHMNVPIMEGEKPLGILGVSNKATPYNHHDVNHLSLLAQGLSNLLSRKRYTEDLEKAKDEAEMANKAKSEFLAHMSHEIRTPLNGVIGLSELLAGTPLNEKQREYVQMIGESGKSLLFLINDILDFSKIEAGKLDIGSELFELTASVGAVLSSFVPKAREKNLELAVSLCQHLPSRVMGDPGRLQQILLNLVGNAVKFTDTGGVRIDIEIESADEESVTIKFSVIDNGIGIPKDRFDRLFKAFSQVDASSARTYGGTGLGLAISKRLVHLLKGNIGVESVVGKGSTFWFTIPFQCEPRVIRCLRTRNCLDKTCPHINGRVCTAFENREIDVEYNIEGRHVLIVDDNKIQREALMCQLQNWGMVCVACSSSKEALCLSEERWESGTPFDMFVIDSTLADTTGITLTRQLFEQAEKRQNNMSAVQVILLRSFSDEVDKDTLNNPRIETIAKPVLSSALFNAVMNRIFTAELQKGTKSKIITLADVKNRRIAGQQSPKESDLSSSPLQSTNRLKSPLAGKIHILIVEDNRINQIVARNILAEAGFTSDIAQNGIEACSAVRNRKYDIVMMDCQMPEMDGFEATRLIRNWERERGRKRLPIIALTANAVKEDIQKCLDSGMDAYCSKPINPQVMIQMIEEWYGKT